MDFRKVINLGKSSYVISLPRQWAKKNNIKKGDILKFYENKNSDLIVSPNERKPVNKSPKIETIQVDNKGISRIRREIIIIK